MADPLGVISSLGAVRPMQPATIRPAAGGPSFRDVLMDQIARADRLQSQAQQAVSVLAGKGVADVADVAELVLAQRRADAAFDALLRVHDTLQRAYEELKQVNV